MKKSGLLLAPLCSLLLAGCLGDVMEIFCEASPDSDHCYQAAAVQEAEPDTCEKIAGEGFKGSNPPRDKCFLQIAGNTGDPTACDGVEGGFMSYSKEECLAGAFKNHTAEDCATADDEMKCRAGWARNGKGCGGEYVWNAASGACEMPKAQPAETENPFETDAVKEDLKTIGDAGKSGYVRLLDWDIEHEADPARKAGLEKYKEFLEKSGEKLDEVATTFEKLQELKKIFVDSYDPKDAVENMSAGSILAPGFFDRLKEKLAGADVPGERDKAEDALTVYGKMLERQKDNDFLQQSRLTRVTDTLVGKAKDEATGRLKESVEDIAKTVAGDAFAAVGIVDHALTSFQEQAKKEMFVGLAAAYNRQRDSIALAHPDWSGEQIHKATVENVKANPYEDVPNSGFVKYGNILENGDCKDAGENPLCIDNRVFWIAMDKTYLVTHK